MSCSQGKEEQEAAPLKAAAQGASGGIEGWNLLSSSRVWKHDRLKFSHKWLLKKGQAGRRDFPRSQQLNLHAIGATRMKRLLYQWWRGGIGAALCALQAQLVQNCAILLVIMHRTKRVSHARRLPNLHTSTR
jgi:hypothetical protein